jgi:alginate O-acetyltransferase complex protein AlgI
VGAFFACVALVLFIGPLSGSVLPPAIVPWLIGVALFVALIVAPVGYRAAQRLPLERRRRLFLIFSLVSNLSMLGVFKYFDFFVTSAESLASSLGVENVELLHLNLILPVGISFYTFQTMSYNIDVYRGKMRATDDYVTFALFVAFFPQLVAGPIERASSLLPALQARRFVTAERVKTGLYLILLGLFKKIAIANGMAVAVNSIYNSSGGVSSLDIALATFCFAVQIYGDFSGYSDIARGSAKLFGIDLVLNFAQPYFSTNPSEFWRRWHISLSEWLRDYLYIPLGGSRDGERRTYRNLALTMLLGGLWHGAAWNFVLWGGYQGLLLVTHRALVRSGAAVSAVGAKLWKPLVITGFFALTCYGWLLFRANSFEQIATFTTTLLFGFDWTVSMLRPTLSAVFGLVVLLFIDVMTYRTGDAYFHRRLPAVAQGLLFALLLFILAMGLSNAPTQFIYFQF